MFNKSAINVLLLLISSFLIALYALLFQVFGVQSTDKATIISGFLSMIGGAIGAMGAYLVARGQINNEKKIDKIKSLSHEIPIYINLTLEFEKIIVQLKEIEKKKKIQKYIKAGSETEFFSKLIIKFDSINWNRWSEINKISDSILLKELLKFEESFKRMSEVLEYNIQLKDKKMWGLYNTDEYEYNKLFLEIASMREEKKIYYNEIYYCLQKSEKIYELITTKTLMIESLIDGNSSVEEYPFFSNSEHFRIERDK